MEKMRKLGTNISNLPQVAQLVSGWTGVRTQRSGLELMISSYHLSYVETFQS
jgi:hypothetical protein